MSDQSADAKSARVGKERDELARALLMLMQYWAGIESGFTNIVAAAIGPRNDGRSLGNDAPLASVFIFSVGGLDSRIDITKNCLLVMAQRMGRTPEETALITRLINAVLGKVRDKKRTRNLAMHGTITYSTGQNGETHVFLTPPIMDFVHVDSGGDRKSLSASDLETGAQSLRKYSEALAAFAELICSWRQHDVPTFERILQQLQAQFPQTPVTARPPQNNANPPTPSPGSK